MTHSPRPGCLSVFQSLLGLKSEPITESKETLFPYRVRDDFLSPAELNFYRVLHSIVNNRLVICPKVSLGDLFYPKSGRRVNNQSYRNKIARKHVDFLLCDPASMRPLLGIELDDASHRQVARQARDLFVEQVFEAAGLPLFRQPVQQAYQTAELETVLAEILSTDDLAATGTSLPEHAPSVKEPLPTINKLEEKASLNGKNPLCPKCHQLMVLRTVKKQGKYYGKQFWGCVDYPKCRGVRQYASEETN